LEKKGARKLTLNKTTKMLRHRELKIQAK